MLSFWAVQRAVEIAAICHLLNIVHLAGRTNVPHLKIDNSIVCL
ncbi:protein of unknown function (plasmid) [Cupriavidus taiwanensis]|uniref:Uncharacterized protein n=1 Tax=Cupriavidus taiwanensis TaxID=164546 RepID=A0A375FLL3_9BURK|nr:protein of unknown function [Cupriavidus taiwanensis]SOZ72432.1 protein of unknown function [Cupriavidus taiwanensis]SPA03636.1 protein of unknown function [Cupriavidus taiwanensis]SPA57441.1 protein of unknown function [Cupriavidus taiwanensis]SPD49270.1 protein of unknown function [Cupriavidus taiwanensis]